MQVQAQQEQQENNADIGNVLNQVNIGDQVYTPGSDHDSKANVGDDQRLANRQCQCRQQRRPAKYQEQDVNDRSFSHNSKRLTRHYQLSSTLLRAI